MCHLYLKSIITNIYRLFIIWHTLVVLIDSIVCLQIKLLHSKTVLLYCAIFTSLLVSIIYWFTRQVLLVSGSYWFTRQVLLVSGSYWFTRLVFLWAKGIYCCLGFQNSHTIFQLLPPHRILLVIIIQIQYALHVTRKHCNKGNDGPTRPMTFDFEGFPSQIVSITFLSYLNS